VAEVIEAWHAKQAIVLKKTAAQECDQDLFRRRVLRSTWAAAERQHTLASGASHWNCESHSKSPGGAT
jgi:hypothetical protein